MRPSRKVVDICRVCDVDVVLYTLSLWCERLRSVAGVDSLISQLFDNLCLIKGLEDFCSSTGLVGMVRESL